MTKVEQIIEAIAAACVVALPHEIQVYKHRGLSLSLADGELPGVSVDYGEDSPLTEQGQETLDGVVHSVLTINFACIANDNDEVELRKRLIAMRGYVHAAIRADRKLGLAFVLDTHYGGAEAPEIVDEGETLVGGIIVPWGVMYEFDIDNPDA